MIKALTVGVLGMMLCFVAPNPAASQDQPLTGDEVKKLFEGNTELGEARKGEVDTGRRWTAFYTPDGKIRSRQAGRSEVGTGTWYVDSEGRVCFRWDGWDVAKQTKCDLVVPEDDHYLRVRDGQVRGLIRIQEGSPDNL